MDFLPLELQDEYVFNPRDEYVFGEFEYEDDVFYRELRKQVLQLTEEEEEEEEDDDDDDDAVDHHQEEFYENKIDYSAKQGLNNGTSSSCTVPQERVYYNWPNKDQLQENDLHLQVPKWISNLRRTGNGTGVFIPQIAPSTMIKNKPRRKNGKKGRTQSWRSRENMI